MDVRTETRPAWPLPVAPGQPRTLSEAIRMGAAARPQCFGWPFRVVDGVITSCALGAAAEALGMPITALLDDIVGALGRRFAIDMHWTPVQMPVPPWEFKPLKRCIYSLNDPPYGWTREAIADWLESLGY